MEHVGYGVKSQKQRARRLIIYWTLLNLEFFHHVFFWLDFLFAVGNIIAKNKPPTTASMSILFASVIRCGIKKQHLWWVTIYTQQMSLETFYHSKCLWIFGGTHRVERFPLEIPSSCGVVNSLRTNFQSWKYHEFDSISWVYPTDPTEPRMQAKVWLDFYG